MDINREEFQKILKEAVNEAYLIGMIDRLLVYVAGPYSHSDPVENTHRAIKVADELVELGYSVFVPHITLLWHIVSPRPADFWYAYDFSILKRCDILYRLRGYSKGADKEVEMARGLGMPVFYERDDKYDPLRRQLL